MIRKKVLGIGTTSATLLVQDTEADGALRVLRRIHVAGWEAKDVQATQELYQTFQRANLPGFVQTHAVLLQNAYLNVVTSYCAGGDLANYIDDEVSKPLKEGQVLQWILLVAAAIHQLHQQMRTCFYGLSLDRVYLCNVNDLTEVRVGLPVPPAAYYRTLSDRKGDGVAVEKEYPPEVLEANRHYHPTLTDVWHLGLMTRKLLSAHSDLSQRSPGAREAIRRMMASSLADRASLEQATAMLAAVAGETVQLPKPLPASVPSSGHQYPLHPGTHPNASSSASNGSEGRSLASPSQQAKASSSAAAAATTTTAPPDLSRGKPTGGSTSSALPSPQSPRSSPQPRAVASAPDPDPPTASTTPTARVDDDDDGTGANTLTEHSTPPDVEVTATAGGRRTSEVAAGAHAARGSHRGRDGWHRRALEQFEELQRLNGSPTKHRATSRHASPSGRPLTPRGSRDSATMNTLLNTNNSLSGSFAGPTPGRSPPRQFHSRGSFSPRGGAPAHPIDNNTRAFNEMFAELDEQLIKNDRLREELEQRRQKQSREERAVHDAHIQHTEHLRHIRQDGIYNRQTDIRKHIKEWKTKNEDPHTANGGAVEVTESDGVYIVAPRTTAVTETGGLNATNGGPSQSSSQAPATAGASSASPTPQPQRPPSARHGSPAPADKDGEVPNHNAKVPVSVVVPKRPPPTPRGGTTGGAAADDDTHAGEAAAGASPITSVPPLPSAPLAAVTADRRNGGATSQNSGGGPPPPSPPPSAATTAPQPLMPSNVAGAYPNPSPSRGVSPPTSQRSPEAPRDTGSPRPAPPRPYPQSQPTHGAPAPAPPPVRLGTGQPQQQQPGLTPRGVGPSPAGRPMMGEGGPERRGTPTSTGPGRVPGAMSAPVDRSNARYEDPHRGLSGPPRPIPMPNGVATASSPSSAAAAAAAYRRRLSEAGDVARTRGGPLNAPTSEVATTFASLEWAIDGLRSSIRGLLRDRALYGDVMIAVGAFVARSEEERLSPRFNEAFMQKLKEVIVDNRLFAATAALCAQLAALEGLTSTMRETPQMRSNR